MGTLCYITTTCANAFWTNCSFQIVFKGSPAIICCNSQSGTWWRNEWLIEDYPNLGIDNIMELCKWPLGQLAPALQAGVINLRRPSNCASVFCHLKLKINASRYCSKINVYLIFYGLNQSLQSLRKNPGRSLSQFVIDMYLMIINSMTLHDLSQWFHVDA